MIDLEIKSQTMKTIFPKRIDGKLCLCPFMGYKVENVEDFRNLLQKFYNSKTGYPGLYFKTKDPNITIVFSGHQYETGPNGERFSLFYREDEYPHRWFTLKDKDTSWFDLFMDSKEIESFVKAMTTIINTGGGAEFHLK